MTFLYNIIVSPIESVVDWVFLFIINKIAAIGVIGAVIGVSLAINFLALPLYTIADRLQEKERSIAKALEYRVKRIKKAFKGDEQFMMLSEYYRQNNYHPLYVLRSSLSILIEIPFFIAAYHYLSHNELLRGASWWIFKDLGAPDRFFAVHIGSYALEIHFLPVLMTLINFVSGAIYTKDATFREKAQLYVVALIFLVLLYNSPSGLVIYWILNNIFSLFKNIVMKTKHPVRIAHAVITALFGVLTVYVCSRYGSLGKKAAIVCFTALIAALPLLKKRLPDVLCAAKATNAATRVQGRLPLLVFAGGGLALLCGFVLPASVIATSPTEFSFLGQTASPVSYVWTSFFVFFGFFVFWPLAIYRLFGEKVRRVMPPLFFVGLVCALANVYLFAYAYGNLSVSFTLDDERVLKQTGIFFSLLPLLTLVVAGALYALCVRLKKQVLLIVALFSLCLGELGIGTMKLHTIQTRFTQYATQRQNIDEQAYAANDGIEPIYHLSKTEKNVIVLFLDRAISAFFPQAIAQFPELAEKFTGFTYYPNTVSFSTHTSLGAPAMMGGYEYTPQAMNERSEELLRDKHNEAMLVLPKLFSDAGFEATVSDPPWSNYAHDGDLSPFEPYPNIHAYKTFGKYTNRYFDAIGLRGGVAQNNADTICRKEIRNFSVVQVLYPLVRSTFYRLCRADNQRDDRNYYNIFSSLYFLREQTDFTAARNAYFFIDNDTPHEPHALSDDFLQISDEKKSREQTHYDANVATMLQVGTYLDFLREHDVYDNTRVIIVADHGQGLTLERFSHFSEPTVPASYNPLLLIKDFSDTAPLRTDYAFMTNADTLYAATQGLPVADENPFTHKKLVPQKENGVTLYPLANGEHHADHLLKKTQFTLEKNRAWHVTDNLLEEKNWIPLSVWESAAEEQ